MITYAVEFIKSPDVPAIVKFHGRGLRSFCRQLNPFCLTFEAVSVRSYGKHLVLTLAPMPSEEPSEASHDNQSMLPEDNDTA